MVSLGQKEKIDVPHKAVSLIEGEKGNSPTFFLPKKDQRNTKVVCIS
jgi:hypothetical protein